MKSMHVSPESRIRVQLVELPDAASVNAGIWEQFQALRDDPALQRSHYFAGRYENIYIPETRLAALAPVLRAARQGAEHYLGKPVAGLSTGFWLNEMGPGHVTLPHHHDEDDELVSGVYYVRVPRDSGDLLLTQGEACRRVTPREGLFVFFSPRVMHEVTRNNSDAVRLSVGMNFGVRAADTDD
ncbi:MAG: 2OG-Fe(II) oxygenase [Thiogranum sp.]